MRTYAKVNDVEFDHVFEVTADGKVVDGPESLYAPDVWNVEGQRHPNDITIEAARGDRWEALHGYTGQYSYNGAVMHPSEYIGGGIERDILAAPGVYVVVEVREEDGQYPDGDPIGWVVLRYLGHAEDCGYCQAGEPMTHTYEPPRED